jgi:hypothetical protein
LFQDVFVGTPKWFRAASKLHEFGHLAGDARLIRVACFLPARTGGHSLLQITAGCVDCC